MTENKRFTLHQFGLNFLIKDNGKELSAKQIVDLLNENEQLKQFIMELTTKNTGRIDLANGHSYNVKYMLKGD